MVASQKPCGLQRFDASTHSISHLTGMPGHSGDRMVGNSLRGCRGSIQDPEQHQVTPGQRMEKILNIQNVCENLEWPYNAL